MERRLIMIKNFIKKEIEVIICWNLMDLLDMQNQNLIAIMKEKKNRIEFGSILLIKILLNLQLKRNIEAAFAALIKKLKKININ